MTSKENTTTTTLLPVLDQFSQRYTITRLAEVDIKCTNIVVKTGLSVFSATITSLIMIISIPLNIAILQTIWTQRKQKFKGTFYLLIFHIAVADLLKAIITAPIYFEVNVKKSMRLDYNKNEVISMQLSLFYTDALALLLVTLLSVDRITAMLFPIQHHNGVIAKREKQLLITAWCLAWLFEVPYFFVGFINQFAIVAFTIIGAAGISLISTTLLYKYKLRTKDLNGRMAAKQRKSVDARNTKTSVSQIKFECSDGNESPRALVRIKKNSIIDSQSPKVHNQGQVNATKAFLFILVLFMTTYVPAHAMIMYMLTCTTCDCDIVHPMKNLSQLTILASSLMRPLGFVCSLKHLRTAVSRLVKKII